MKKKIKKFQIIIYKVAKKLVSASDKFVLNTTTCDIVPLKNSFVKLSFKPIPKAPLLTTYDGLT